MCLSNELSYDAGSFSCHRNPHRFFQSEVLRLYFPALVPWVVQSASLSSCSSWFILTQMWDHLLYQLPPHPPQSSSHCFAASPFHPGCSSLPLLLVLMNVSSLTAWLSDFHIVRFSGISGYFLFLNLLSFFWLCEEAQCAYLRLHLGRTSVCGFLTELPQTALGGTR